ncbi:hypothetical protein BDF21DRAFT_424101 [Thamnidium elegans]|nr:hypothetical protein BDF21DRAFT_424101 [Thamnidium elegans]
MYTFTAYTGYTPYATNITYYSDLVTACCLPEMHLLLSWTAGKIKLFVSYTYLFISLFLYFLHSVSSFWLFLLTLYFVSSFCPPLCSVCPFCISLFTFF